MKNRDHTISHYETFDDWFYEIENYGTRSERFFEEWDNGMDPKRMIEWLIAAYDCGKGTK